MPQSSLTNTYAYIGYLENPYSLIDYLVGKYSNTGAHSELYQNVLHSFPVLSIDRPYAVGTSGQLRTRIQAFVESLEIKRINAGRKL